MNLEHKDFLFLDTRSDGDQGIISGYASTYTKDAYGDVIQPGAFAQSIKDKRGRVPILFGHDAASWVGFSTSLAEDHKGLLATAKLATTTTGGRDAFELVKAAQAADYRVGLSIGFVTKDWDNSDDGGRLLKEIDLWEISLTPFPANRLSRIDEAKSVRLLERTLRDEAGLTAAEAKRVIALFGTTSGPPPTPSRDVQGLRQLQRAEQLSRAFRETWR